MIFHITRTRLVTERFRVTADSEDEAYDALAAEDQDAVEKLEESTLKSDAETTAVEKE